jgi:hypothetical protein
MIKLAKLVAYIFHPILLPFLVCLLYMVLCPAFFINVPAKTLGLWKIQIFVNTIMFPLLVSFLIYKLGFAKSIFLQTSQERLGPLMATILFYFWNFYVFHKVTIAPVLMKSFLLGTFITVSFIFLSTIFVKVSMHAAGVCGALMALILFYFNSTCLPVYVLLIATLITAIVIASRLITKDHTKAELVLGGLIGLVSQLLIWFLYNRYFVEPK